MTTDKENTCKKSNKLSHFQSNLYRAITNTRMRKEVKSSFFQLSLRFWGKSPSDDDIVHLKCRIKRFLNILIKDSKG